ncbi:hypothetical protein LFUMFP_500006 [Latilactobacillus fuchuensis]|uniref:HTH araC/xylS-type domain-containing protein n=2 Tax=Latilactobacillus fuchuensis TaxID=164393 RepID=A0A2N9DY17_9LACO|nr:hypothetical protein LFUMFP_500006 [Latilactobacillus fuchuensis]
MKEGIAFREVDMHKLIFANNQLIPNSLARYAKLGNVILYIVDIEGHLVTQVYGSLEMEPAMLINNDVGTDLTVSGVQQHNYQLEHTSLPLKVPNFNEVVGYSCCAQYIDKHQSKDLSYREEAAAQLEEISEVVQDVVQNYLKLNLLMAGQEQFVFDIPETTNVPVVDNEESQTSDIMDQLRHLALTNAMIISAVQFIDENIEMPLTLDKVAAHVYLSPYYFSKLFHKETNLSFSTYLSARKIQKATDLLTNKKLTVKEVASRLNFPQVSYFSQIFKKYMQCTPSEYRKQVNS